MKIRSIGFFFLAAVTAALVGCGGGGGGGEAPPVQPTRAIVKLATSGTLPAGTLIGGIGTTTVTYPTTKGLSITDSNVVTSGVGISAGSFLIPNLTIPGQAKFIMANVQPGIAAGEFATLTFSIASGNSPVAGDFVITEGATPVLDTNSVAISGVSVIIQSVTFQ
ncbi:MAG: hypothetical protein FD174_351 [Geobacteraceae bacterium]|nr:MAG: hypothetical protein FD174_351 [Geobacteraceae bacterium]